LDRFSRVFVKRCPVEMFPVLIILMHESQDVVCFAAIADHQQRIIG
jgi:hypothetical protein